MNTPPPVYPFAEVESRVNQQWEDAGIFNVDEKSDKPKFYCLSMFPYPSGRLHMGHVRNYTIGDMITRYRRMSGYNVLQPLGWDAFGMPAENAAIDNNIPPAQWTRHNIDEMRAQLKRLGLAIDWRRELATCEPEYYRWEQQFFARLFKKGLIYKKSATVNWDPIDNTVLANEQVVDGRGWRSGAPVERRNIEMYFMAITQYAQELLSELDNLDGWPESVKTMQRHWIGRSEGARIFLSVIGEENLHIECFTTRPDTIFGATFCAIAPEHPLATKCALKDNALAAFIEDCSHLGVSEEALEKVEKRGYDTGLRVAHPFISERQLPVFVANFILAQYGTGAIYGCPAHDQRDLDFARAHGLLVVPVVSADGSDNFSVNKTAYTGDGKMINSDFLNGLTTTQAKQAAIDAIEKIGGGNREIQYRLRDWGISRQRYWGCPIPIIHCPQCKDVLAPEEDLPVLLPRDVTISGRGSALADKESFVNCSCPNCGAPARREVDTLDTFFESSWYFARYASYDCANAMTDNRAAYWMPVDQYIGGIEHACLHLLYARFFHKLMRDANMYPDNKKYNEPFANLLCQGMVLNHVFYDNNDGKMAGVSSAEVTAQKDSHGAIIGGLNTKGQSLSYGGRVKMSKSANNGVDPTALIKQYGADTARLFILFASPPDQSLDWSDDGIKGCMRFLNRLWSLAHEFFGWKSANDNAPPTDFKYPITAARLRVHEILAKADYDMRRLRLNNIPSAAMSIIGEIKSFMQNHRHHTPAAEQLIEESLSIVLRLLAPAVPHITQALWEKLGHQGFIADAPWPQADPQVLSTRSQTTIVVQINGRRREQITVDANASHEHIEQAARACPIISRALSKTTPRKVIIVPGRIINFVI